MKRIERELERNKEVYVSMKAPEDMEQKLRDALLRQKRIRMRILPAAVSLLAVAVLVTYSFDAIAYLGKILTGYEPVIEESLERINKEGGGQQIGKTVTFSNNISVTVDRIVFDENEMTVFYKAYNPEAELDPIEYGIKLNLYGIKHDEYRSKGGRGVLKDSDKHTMNGICSFEVPQFFEKWMTIEVTADINRKEEKQETKKVTFALNRNLAIAHVIKKDVDYTTQIGDWEVRFETITASVLNTYVQGSMAYTGSAQNEQDIPCIEFDLFAGDEKITPRTAEISRSAHKVDFQCLYHVLPEEISSLEIRNVRMEDSRTVDKEVIISTETDNLKICEDLTVRDVRTRGDTLYVTFLTRGVPVFGLFYEGMQLNCKKPDAGIPQKPSPENPVELTYEFEGRGDSFVLKIKSIGYFKVIDEKINIPVE